MPALEVRDAGTAEGEAWREGGEGGRERRAEGGRGEWSESETRVRRRGRPGGREGREGGCVKGKQMVRKGRQGGTEGGRGGLTFAVFLHDGLAFDQVHVQLHLHTVIGWWWLSRQGKKKVSPLSPSLPPSLPPSYFAYPLPALLRGVFR
jgi:hypothetical protein